MDAGGHRAPPNAGEVLLQLLRNPPTSKSTTSQQQQGVLEDPAVAAIGPAIPLQRPAFPSDGGGLLFPQWSYGSPSTQTFVPDHYFKKTPDVSPNLNADVSLRRDQFIQSSRQVNDHVQLGGGSRNFRAVDDSSRAGVSREVEQGLVFGSFNPNVSKIGSGDVLIPNFRGGSLGNASVNGGSGMADKRFNRHPAEANDRRGNSRLLRVDEQAGASTTVNHRKQSFIESHRAVVQPPGFSNNARNAGNREYEYTRRIPGQQVDGHKSYLNTSDRSNHHRREFPRPLSGNRVEDAGNFSTVRAANNQRRESPPGSVETVGHARTRTLDDASTQRRESPPGSCDGGSVGYVGICVAGDALESAENGEELRSGGQDKASSEFGLDDGLYHKLSEVLEVSDETLGKPDNKKHHRDKDYRADNRGHWIMNQRMRHAKSQMRFRSDIYRFDAPFLEIFKSLIPAEEEKMKQMQLIGTLEELVIKEWPDARLHLYGSCANSFGFPKSDIDVCLVMELENTDKTEVLLKLAEILESGNLQDVQAFTRARVPIVKLKDPATGIACDICVNNVLAVVNTRLLRDYARIDNRLQQLAFIVKHWAKSRLVNETYHGTLSSYAYVLMCIHLLQQRRPPILPSLQEMEATYSVNVENVECAYFDQVDRLQNFGSGNQETIAILVWAFFHYWAYCHDYSSDVISIRTGTTLSKHDKDWTRRVGNDRHLICIEDPFEVSHDLGRVVDKHSVRVLREEFERAARIMQHDPNPWLTLFEPYVPN